LPTDVTKGRTTYNKPGT